MDNSKIHYRYAISYLISAIILLLALSYYQVPDLVNKLSFALTLSSLLLAILAIFYTVAAAYKQDSQLSKLIETHSELKAAAKEIRTVSENLNSTLNVFPSHFEEISSKIDDIAEKYASPNLENLPHGIKADKSSHIIDLKIDKALLAKMVANLQYRAMLVLYIFFQSSYKSKNIEYTALSALGISSDYAIGFLNGFGATGLIDFKIHKKTIIPTLCSDIIYDNLKSLIDLVINALEKGEKDQRASYLRERIEEIDGKINR